MAAEKTGLPPEKIGTIFISPCPAKVTTILNPVGLKKSNLDGAIAISEIYPQLRVALKKMGFEVRESASGSVGLGWGCTGGEASASLDERYLAADGIENCIRVLESLEDEKFNVDFIELNACPGGCVGGVLTVENPFVAMTRMKSLRKNLNTTSNRLPGEKSPSYYMWEKALNYSPVMELGDDINSAIEKMSRIDQITESLQGLDCGSCGSPSCRAFAEDIVNGQCKKDECIFVLRESIHSLAKTLADFSKYDKINTPEAENDSSQNS